MAYRDTGVPVVPVVGAQFLHALVPARVGPFGAEGEAHVVETGYLLRGESGSGGGGGCFPRGAGWAGGGGGLEFAVLGPLLVHPFEEGWFVGGWGGEEVVVRSGPVG